ncbi:hypothetical protein [Leptospira idonii]|uniref:Uncharacterized protein n=1 Tax=Leptospira idonii TaxID=1193500 RepID=A0A4R9M048_9LEPT|nr:hypothetical protein [Leptospira idonii]TGN19017.1 hypothetical protein EHS15_11450 [Leptospira idonii]
MSIQFNDRWMKKADWQDQQIKTYIENSRKNSGIYYTTECLLPPDGYYTFPRMEPCTILRDRTFRNAVASMDAQERGKIEYEIRMGEQADYYNHRYSRRGFYSQGSRGGAWGYPQAHSRYNNYYYGGRR